MGWSWLGLQCRSLAPATWAALREGPGALREPGVPGKWGERAGEGFVLQSEDLQLLTHSCVRHSTNLSYCGYVYVKQ